MDQDLSLVHELAFGSPFPMVDALLSLDAGGKGFVLHQLNGPCFVEPTMEALCCHMQQDGWGRGGERVGVGEGEETEVGMQNK